MHTTQYTVVMLFYNIVLIHTATVNDSTEFSLLYYITSSKDNAAKITFNIS